jgi:hypothetical protein
MPRESECANWSALVVKLETEGNSTKLRKQSPSSLKISVLFQRYQTAIGWKCSRGDTQQTPHVFSFSKSGEDVLELACLENQFWEAKSSTIILMSLRNSVPALTLFRVLQFCLDGVKSDEAILFIHRR